MTLVSRIADLASRVSTEFNTVRTELAGKADTGHSHSVDASSVNLYAYGSSHAIVPTTYATDSYLTLTDQRLRMGTVTSYAQSGRRIFEAVGGAINSGAFPGMTAPVSGAGWPSGTRKGVVVIDSLFNDIGHYADTGAVPVALPSDDNYVDGVVCAYRTLMALVSSASRVENQAFSAASAGWTAAGGAGYSGTQVYHTSTTGAWLEYSIKPPQTGPLAGKVFLLGYRIPTSSGALSPYSISVDGAVVNQEAPLPWESYVGHSGASVVIVPEMAQFPVPVDGAAHTVRVTHTGAGGFVYVDALLVPSETPNPIFVMESLVPKVGVWTQPQIDVWKANKPRIEGAVRGVLTSFPNAYWVPSSITDNGLLASDGAHMNDRGMAQRTADLSRAIEGGLSAWLESRYLEALPDASFTII